MTAEKNQSNPERANRAERTKTIERAMLSERTKLKERAIHSESTMSEERANHVERTTIAERAMSAERTTTVERATVGELSMSADRWLHQYLNEIETEAVRQIALLETVRIIMKINTAPKVISSEKGKDRVQAKAWETLKREFWKQLTIGTDALLNAGKVLAKMIDLEPDTKEILIKENPNIRFPFLEALESVGRRRRHPDTLRLGSIPIANKIASLPIEQQDQIFGEGIPVLVEHGNKEVMELRKPAEATYKEANLAIGPEGLRSEDEQREEKKRRKIAKVLRADGRYEMDGKDLVVTCRCRFTPAEARKMFDEWEKAQ
jgi:DNA-binding transcriptional regulator YdaS (Cro superfamily)